MRMKTICLTSHTKPKSLITCPLKESSKLFLEFKGAEEKMVKNCFSAICYISVIPSDVQDISVDLKNVSVAKEFLSR